MFLFSGLAYDFLKAAARLKTEPIDEDQIDEEK